MCQQAIISQLFTDAVSDVNPEINQSPETVNLGEK